MQLAAPPPCSTCSSSTGVMSRLITKYDRQLTPSSHLVSDLVPVSLFRAKDKLDTLLLLENSQPILL